MISLVPSLLLPMATAFALVHLLWGQERSLFRHALLKTSLSVGIGMGVASVLFFVWLSLFGSFNGGYVVLELLLFLASLAAVVRFQRARKSAGLPPSGQGSGRTALDRVLMAGFFGLTALSAAAFVHLTLNRPHGGWDAWAMWNMKGRFLFRGGEHWKDLFHVAPGFHPDYPLFLPGLIARCWSYIGNDDTVVPAALALLFTFATVFLLQSSLSALRGRNQGYVAGIALLGTSIFLSEGSSQYADVYLGYFYAATVALFCLHCRFGGNRPGFLILAGVTAGLSAWVKNEGMVFFPVVVLAHFAAVASSDGLKAYARQAVFLALGSLPVLLAVLYFKYRFAPPPDLLVEQGFGALLRKATELSRYHEVGSAYLKELFLGFPLPVLIVFLFLMGVEVDRPGKTGLRFSLLVLGIMFAVYFMVYVTTPKSLQWHLGTSLRRVLFQIWPMFLFNYFSVVRPP